MFQSSLELLKDYVLQHNTYFNDGFANVYLDDSTGFISENKKGDNIPVFPADNLGDYFYFRLPKDITFSRANEFMNGCPNGGHGVVMDIILVACVKGANNDRLLENLIITLSKYINLNITLKKAIALDENVIYQELSNIKESERNAALKRLPFDYSIVSLTFTVTINYDTPKLSCIVNPCEC